MSAGNGIAMSPEAAATMAATSPDPAIRAIAVRRMGMAAEINRWDEQLALYVKERRVESGRRTDELKQKFRAAMPGKNIREEFKNALRAIFLKRGVPLSCVTVLADMHEQYPYLTVTTVPRDFGYRMREAGILIQVKRELYWLKDVPLPGTESGK